LPFSRIQETQAKEISERPNYSSRQQATYRAMPSCKGFDCFRLQELFHMKVARALMEVAFQLLVKFAVNLLAPFCC
jgi:hypothetical protein